MQLEDQSMQMEQLRQELDARRDELDQAQRSLSHAKQVQGWGHGMCPNPHHESLSCKAACLPAPLSQQCKQQPKELSWG